MPDPKMTAPEIETQPEALPELVEASPTTSDLVVDLWFVENFYNAGPELTTPLFNRFNQAKDDLKRRLNALS